MTSKTSKLSPGDGNDPYAGLTLEEACEKAKYDSGPDGWWAARVRPLLEVVKAAQSHDHGCKYCAADDADSTCEICLALEALPTKEQGW